MSRHVFDEEHGGLAFEAVPRVEGVMIHYFPEFRPVISRGLKSVFEAFGRLPTGTTNDEDE